MARVRWPVTTTAVISMTPGAGRVLSTRSSSTARPTESVQDDVPVADTVPEDTGPQPVMPAGFEPRRPRNLQYSAPSEDGGVETHGAAAEDPFANVGRNDMCPCGSGRKYKRCHGDPRHA